MRILAFLLITLSSTSAQTDAGKLLEQGLKQAVAGLAPVPVKDKAAVLAATTGLLAKHITLRADGSASAYYTMPSTRRPVEWRKFVVTQIVTRPERTGNDAGLPPGMSRGR